MLSSRDPTVSNNNVNMLHPDHISARNWTNLLLALGIFVFNIIIASDDILNLISGYGWVIVYFVVYRLLQRFIQCCCIDRNLCALERFYTHLFDFNKSTWITICTAIVTISLLSTNIIDYKLISIFFGVHALLEYVKHDECKFLTSCWIKSSKGLNYATGMAYNYFYGYLNITLPDNGDENKGFKEMMENYENVHGIEFPVKKIFLLVPSLLFCPTNLANACQNNTDVYLEACGNLGVVERNVAGVMQRQYKHSVYKIHIAGERFPTYVVAECTTPLHTFYKVIQSAGPHQENYESHKDDLVIQFYLSIKQIIENSIECKNLCEIVYFDNANPNLNAARLLLDKINELKSEN